MINFVFSYKKNKRIVKSGAKIVRILKNNQVNNYIAHYDGFRILSLAALIVTVSIGFFVVKRFTCAIPMVKE